ncbi:hypothetical protein [Mangrovibacillus cuniculi]|uniref:GyrI-like small molecule binding domain-containing protein n=1 Tax=Mangrovibacillus cuniculi TaxID=2593652 RepID=A0A7S8CD48_9BACI|nr:hypothetical protein [Mangrovibacillus cuniculi]QPC47593.1 hypothetical protein G8O30_11835 [Mangrovibacillus cuniculi]
MIKEQLTALIGMEYVELEGDYAFIRGKTVEMDILHHSLQEWMQREGLQQDLSRYIVEAYYPSTTDEMVEILIPTYTKK